MKRVLVVGDVMLDEYVYGDANRISPEAASPVLSVDHKISMAGGAGNVARGIAALNCGCDLVGVVGEDRAGTDLLAELGGCPPHLAPYLITHPRRLTPHKTRFVSRQHSSHLLRVDRENPEPLSKELEDKVIKLALGLMHDCEVLVLSDYCKGVITNRVAVELLSAARARNKISIVDSKNGDISRFRRATILKLNMCELGFCYDEPDNGLVAGRAIGLAAGMDIDHVVVTRGEDGISMYSNFSSTPVHIPGKEVRVRDVSGAGDTVVATLATELAGGSELVPALTRANDAAAIAVGKYGTATVSLAELLHHKIASPANWDLIDQRLNEWQEYDIGFTNGCFDLLHPGHLHLLKAARGRCDRLIVGLNCDASVRRLKGAGRPVQSEQDRAAMLAALDFVDLVVIFSGDDPSYLVKRIAPSVLVKGSDYNAETVAGHEYAESVYIVDRIDASTTQTIARIKCAES